MGWIFSIAFMIAAIFNRDVNFIIAAGLFAISGSIGLNGPSSKK